MIVGIDTNCILPGRVGGIENYTMVLIDALLGHAPAVRRLVLVTRPENHELFARYASSRCDVVLVPRPMHNGNPVSDWAALAAADAAAHARLLAEFQKRKVDLIRAHGVDVVHFPGNAINPLDIDLPVVLNLHDLQHRYFPQYFDARELANRERWWTAAAQRADALVATTSRVAADLEKHLGVERSRIVVTHPPVEPDVREVPAAQDLDDVRRRLIGRPITFLYPAAAWPHKNHARLIRAFAQAKIPDAQLLLCGSGQETSQLPELVRSLGASDKVRLIGRISARDLRCLYHLVTATIVPSEFEASSLPVMEAMTCGCPVACSNVTSLPELVGDAGILFDARDERAMADAMRRLASDETLRRHLSIRGKERMSRLTPQRFADGVVQAYRHAIGSYRQRRAA